MTSSSSLHVLESSMFCAPHCSSFLSGRLVDTCLVNELQPAAERMHVVVMFDTQVLADKNHFGFYGRIKKVGCGAISLGWGEE